jgi:hypothetical protein
MNQGLQAAIELGRTLRDKATAEYEEEERQREYQRQQEILKMWMPYIAAVRSVVPDFAVIIPSVEDEPSYYARHDDYDRQYRPVSVGVGEYIPPLRAWTDCSTGDDGAPRVKFAAGSWKLYCPEDTGQWIVVPNYGTYAVTSYQIKISPRNDFYLALAEAAEEANIYPQRLADAQRLNEEAAAYKEAQKYKREMEKIEKETGTGPLPPDPMERIADSRPEWFEEAK